MFICIRLILLKNVPPRFTVKIQDGGMCIENYEFDNVFIRKVRGKWHKIVPVLGGGKHKIKRKSVCFWMDMGNISSRSDEILIFSLALRARENIKFHHYSMRYIPYPFKTNRYPLYIYFTSWSVLSADRTPSSQSLIIALAVNRWRI